MFITVLKKQGLLQMLLLDILEYHKSGKNCLVTKYIHYSFICTVFLRIHSGNWPLQYLQ